MKKMLWEHLADRLPRKDLEGSGGGGKYGGTKDDSNNLRANSTAQVLFLVGEGQTKGVKGGKKGLILDDTFVQNSAGEDAIFGVEMYERNGLPTQDAIPGFDAVATEINVGVKVEQPSPVTRQLTDSDFTSVVVSVMIPSLVHSTDKGMKKTSVSFRLEVSYNGGPFINPLGDITITGKNTSPYVEQYRMELPRHPTPGSNSHPWSIRMTRITEDSTSDKKQNETHFQSMTGLIDVTLQYPDSALIGLKFDAKKFDNSTLPKAEAIYEGMYLKVPSNYNTTTRTYSGVWDGTFKYEYSNNPAWFYYTMAENRRYGIGRFLDSTAIDKWTLYSIAQVCDEMVSDGYGGEEPRFSINAYIAEEFEVYELMQLIASAFRGMSYWGAGSVTASQDVLSDPKNLVVRGNVLDGEFNYSSSALTARHTVVHVRYRDKRDDYRPAVEVVRDADAMMRYGERVKEVDGFGITSRAAANRLGRWILYTELNETQALTYQASFDHGIRRPGDVISVMDPEQSNADYGGRLVGGNTHSTVNLDREVVFDPVKDYVLHVVMPDGTLESSPVTTTGTSSAITVSTPFTDVPLDEAIWIVASNTVEPKPYRIVSVLERAKNVFEITALEIYVPKYALIDEDNPLDEPNYRDPLTPEPPTNLTSQEVFFYENGIPKTELLFSWKAPSNMLSPLFSVEVDTPDAENEFVAYNLRALTYQVDNSAPGAYTIRVYSMSTNGRARSAAATLTVTADGMNLADLITVSNIQIIGETGNEFFGADVPLKWQNVAATSSATNVLYQQNKIEVFDNTVPASPVLLGEYFTTTPTFTYSFKMNQADAAALSREPARYLKFRISAQDTQERWGPHTDFACFNAPLDAPAVTFEDVIRQVIVNTVLPPLKDVRGQRIHIDTVSSFTPNSGNLAYEGASSFVSIPLPAGSYFGKVGLYDAFSNVPVHYTSAIGFTVTDVVIDTEAPAIPTGLDIASALQADGRVRVTFTWNPNTETDLAGYVLAVKLAAGTFIEYPVGGTTYELTVLPGTLVTAKVRAYDGVGNPSGFSPEDSHTAALDTTPPAAPTGLVVTAGLDSLWLKWNANTEADLDYYEVYENTTNSSGTATLIGTVGGTATARTGLALETTRYYWIKAVDTSKNKSAFSAVGSGTTGALPPLDEVTMVGPFFNPNQDATNRLSWTAGSISYGPRGSAPTTKAISAGFVNWTSGTIYVYYVPGNTVLSTTTNIVTMYASEGIFIGVYKGGTDFQLSSGGSLINGGLIMGQTIGAAQLVTNQAVITGTAQIANAIITNGHIVSLSAVKLEAGTAIANSITVSGRALGSIANVDVLFDDISEDWIVYQNGSPASLLSYSTNAANIVTGSRSIFVGPGDDIWMESADMIPFDPDKLYKITFRIRRISGTAGNLYLGFNGYAADKTTRVNVNGLNSGSAQHYVVLNAAAQSGVPTTFTEYTGYVKGHAATGMTGTGTIASPRAAHSAVRYMRPMAIFNYQDTAGSTMVLDSAKIEIVNEDAAAVVNAGTTKILPGSITISGSTLLTSWISGTDATKIEGGAIGANSIEANSLKIGSRGLSFRGMDFEVKSVLNGTVSWTSGVISYVADNGSITSVNIAAGSADFASVGYIYWTKGATTLSTTTTISVTQQPDNVMMAAYHDNTSLQVFMGGTIINGNRITTGSISTIQIAAQAITTQLLAADAVTSDKIAANSITAKQMVLADYSNMFLDYDFLATDQYSGDPSIVTFWGTAVTNRGKNAMQITPADGVDYSSYSPYARLEPGTDYYAEVSLNTGADPGSRVMVYVVLYTMDASGNYVGTRTLTIGDKTNTTSTAREGAAFTTAGDERAYRVRFRRYSGVTPGYFGGFVLRRRTNANLLVDGTVTAVKIGANQINGTHITSNAITSVHISAGTINATHITAAKINADQILQDGTTITDLIAANAVTQAAGSWASGGVSLGTSFTVAASITISNPTGSPVIVWGEVLARVSANASTDTNYGLELDAYLQRNGVTIRSRQISATGRDGGTEVNEQVMTFNYYDAAPGAGSQTYTIGGTRSGGSGSGSGSASLSQRFLSCLIRKR